MFKIWGYTVEKVGNNVCKKSGEIYTNKFIFLKTTKNGSQNRFLTQITHSFIPILSTNYIHKLHLLYKCFTLNPHHLLLQEQMLKKER